MQRGMMQLICIVLYASYCPLAPYQALTTDDTIGICASERRAQRHAHLPLRHQPRHYPCQRPRRRHPPVYACGPLSAAAPPVKRKTCPDAASLDAQVSKWQWYRLYSCDFHDGKAPHAPAYQRNCTRSHDATTTHATGVKAAGVSHCDRSWRHRKPLALTVTAGSCGPSNACINCHFGSQSDPMGAEHSLM